jgi:hypothetical protein
VNTDRPGRELAQNTLYRPVVDYLIDSQGWSYKLAKHGGCPLLLPADQSQGVIRVPKTGHARGYRYANWVAAIRRAGGHWPPARS